MNVNRTVVNNPVYYGGGAYGWNHGVAWAPAYGYYGGGFWGAMAIGVTSAAVSPRYTARSFRQTIRRTRRIKFSRAVPDPRCSRTISCSKSQCGPPGLVVIYGPDNSVICANPNNLVAAGNYDLNTETLSLTNQ